MYWPDPSTADVRPAPILPPYKDEYINLYWPTDIRPAPVQPSKEAGPSRLQLQPTQYTLRWREPPDAPSSSSSSGKRVDLGTHDPEFLEEDQPATSSSSNPWSGPPNASVPPTPTPEINWNSRRTRRLYGSPRDESPVGVEHQEGAKRRQAEARQSRGRQLPADAVPDMPSHLLVHHPSRHVAPHLSASLGTTRPEPEPRRSFPISRMGVYEPPVSYVRRDRASRVVHEPDEEPSPPTARPEQVDTSALRGYGLQSAAPSAPAAPEEPTPVLSRPVSTGTLLSHFQNVSLESPQPEDRPKKLGLPSAVASPPSATPQRSSAPPSAPQAAMPASFVVRGVAGAGPTTVDIRSAEPTPTPSPSIDTATIPPTAPTGPSQSSTSALTSVPPDPSPEPEPDSTLTAAPTSAYSQPHALNPFATYDPKTDATARALNLRAPSTTDGPYLRPLDHVLGQVDPPQAKGRHVSGGLFSWGATEDEEGGSKTLERVKKVVDFLDSEPEPFRSVATASSKVWIAPKALMREDAALYFPNLSGTPLMSALEDRTVHTTDICQGRITLVSCEGTMGNIEQCQTFTSPAWAAFKHDPDFNLVHVNIQSTSLKALLVPYFAKNIRTTTPIDQQPSYIICPSAVHATPLGAALGMKHALAGYVYLLDENLKIRWAGSGSASPEEIKSMLVGTKVLLHRFKTNPKNERWYGGSRTEEAERFPCKGDTEVRVVGRWLDRRAEGKKVGMVAAPREEEEEVVKGIEGGEGEQGTEEKAVGMGP